MNQVTQMLHLNVFMVVLYNKTYYKNDKDMHLDYFILYGLVSLSTYITYICVLKKNFL